jgi:glyoxylase-like metal-dependent hydrolase (beta-lactamase superfamily II)
MSDSAPPISEMVTTDPDRARPRVFAQPGALTDDVFMHPLFVNTYAMASSDGLMLIDPGIWQHTDTVHRAVRAWSDAPLHTAVYTHGHADHAFGLRAFLKAGDRPEIIAQENCVARFRRYEQTWGLNARINQRQFSLPKPTFPKQFERPTLTFRDSLVRRHGDLQVELFAGKGETDDACYVWVPERRYLFTGDFIIWQAPNCGNPQKVQRYPVEWADTLARMATFDAEWLFPGHGLVVKGADAVRRLLLETARYLRVLIEQVLERMNAGEAPEAIAQAVEADPELAGRPYLGAGYDNPKFIVRNLLRYWGGWWNGNAATLLPASEEAQAREIASLAGGTSRLVARGRALLAQGDAVLAAHVAEWATRSEPSDREAQRLKRDVYDRRTEEETSLMGKGIYRAAANDAREALGEEPTGQQRTFSLGGSEE